MDRTWTIVGVGRKRGESSLFLLDSPEPQESLEWYSNSAPFEILRRVALWRAQYDESYRRGLRGGGLPCGGCQRFESAYLQPVNLADTMIAPNFSNSAVRSMISHSWTLIRSFHLAAP
ncbi:hypothetical protein IEQ34_023638 [Dendrobium chrysotoxum]|uniref:Uncharacterized protein n=1 Tax=Dendrobium chrysotoxum TaxID=161865 RepID=A0AAV7FUP4_DENCH|nr:hypothetical protein IEQ34_023638 [Dendrobium chrysotoxum]